MKHAILSLVLLPVIVILMGSCHRSPTTTFSPTPANTGAPRVRTPIILWHGWPSPEQHTLIGLINQYNQTHQTQVIVQAMPIASLTTDLRTAAHMPNGPHLVILSNHLLGALAEEGHLLPLESLASTLPMTDLISTTVQSAHASDSLGETHLFGIPLTFDTLVLYYDQRYLPTPPSDMATLLADAHRLTDPATQTWGFAYTLSLDKTIGYLPAFGGRIFDSSGTLILGTDGRAGTEEWLTWLHMLRHDESILALNDAIAVESAIRAQTVIMTIDWAHAYATYHARWGEDAVGVQPLPSLTPDIGMPEPYVQTDVICLTARTHDPMEQQAARDLMSYLLTDTAQEALLAAGRQPVLLQMSSEGAPNPTIGTAPIFRVQAQRGQPMPTSPLAHGPIREELERMQLAVLRNLASPADAVTTADTALRDRLQLPSAR